MHNWKPVEDRPRGRRRPKTRRKDQPDIKNLKLTKWGRISGERMEQNLSIPIE